MMAVLATLVRDVLGTGDMRLVVMRDASRMVVVRRAAVALRHDRRGDDGAKRHGQNSDDDFFHMKMPLLRCCHSLPQWPSE